MAKLIVLFVVVALLGSALSAPSCNADFSIYTQPPNWPTGMNANLNINVNGVNLANGWTIQFTAKGYGQKAPFHISSFWNAGNVSKQLNDDNTATYTVRDAGYNKQTPSNIGFLADTTLPHPRNAICGVKINGVACSLSTSPAVFPPAVPSSSILLNYTVYNKNNTALPVLVLLHGLTEDRRAWDPLIPLFTPHYRVLALDLRGHGLSRVTIGKEGYAPDSLASDVYRTVVAVFGANTLPLVVGHSLGGTVATVYGHLFPVRGTLIVDQSMDLVQFQGLVKSLEPNLRAAEPIFQGTMLAVFDQLYGALNQSERTRLDAIRAPRQEVVLGVWAVLLDLTPAQLIAYVDNLLQSPGGLSTLSLFGTPADGYFDWINARIPGALVEYWLELPTHYPHLAFPYRFAQRVLDFDAFATARLCK